MQSNTQKQNITVYIVEDSAIVVDRLNNIINDLPNAQLVGTANNITTAFTEINALKPNALILDIHLKENAQNNQNGIDLLQKIRATNRLITIIMLTNMGNAIYKEKCLSLGANYFLDKSIDFTNIADILTSINIQNDTI
jgi:DNA-binding NarL/FixJ family response regulator